MNSNIVSNNIYTLEYHHTENDLNRLENYYKKAYQMAEHRIEQELGSNEVVIGSFITARNSTAASLGLGDNDIIATRYWVLNERTNKITEVSVPIHTSTILGEGFEKNLMNCPITGNDYVKFSTISSKDVITIEPATLYNVGNSRVISTMSAAKSDRYAFVDDKYHEL